MFLSVQPRTAGFNAIDYGDARVETLVLTQALMLIGGGSASTAGGIKVGTFIVLVLVVVSEVRGKGQVDAFGRSVPSQLLRRAFSVAFMALLAVSVGMLAIVATSSFEPEEAFFESVSAFATVGLSTGITPELNAVGQLTCIVLMYAGRVGLVTVALALAFRERERRYAYPEERPLIG
jgi:Trk-type K+ transport system membrane component